MINIIHRIRYALMNILGAKAKAIIHNDCEPVLRDDFRDLAHWVCTRTPTVASSRYNGATLSIHVANTKGYICPTIISHTVVRHGNISAVLSINPYELLENVFTVRNKDTEWGFKITENRIRVVFPSGFVTRKLYHPMKPHKFTIDFDAGTKKTFWLIDDIIIYETNDNIPLQKRVCISLGTIGTKIASKELPQSLNLKSVTINTYNEKNK